jgi:hypothetical protein
LPSTSCIVLDPYVKVRFRAEDSVFIDVVQLAPVANRG